MATTAKRSTKKRPTTPDRTDVDIDAKPMDGRAARAMRTRTAIVDALLSLLEEGDLQPPANRIAERAGISLRLIYHHFGDLESLFSAAAKREGERMAALATPIDLAAPLDARIHDLVAERTKMLEWITPVRRAALLQEPFSTELTAARQAFFTVGEQQVRSIFGPELDQLDEPRRAVVVSALHGVLLWGYWNDLRVSGRSLDEARDALELTVTAILAAAGRGQPPAMAL